MADPQWKKLPWRNADYLNHVRSHPCCVCRFPVSVAHHEQEKGQGGKATKASDDRTLSLCHACHSMRHSQGRMFWRRNSVDPEQVIERLQQEWRDKGGVIP